MSKGPISLVLIGDSSFAEIAREYFEQEGNYKVKAFLVERAFIKQTTKDGLPVLAFEDMERHFDKSTYVFVAITYNQLNRVRKRLYEQVKMMGYPLASYISPKAFIASSAVIGDHCFIFENNVVQSFVQIGENTILWSGNHIGHHSKIGSHNFISSHVVISGHCKIGMQNFIGVNASIGHGVCLGDDIWLEPGSIVTTNLVTGSIVKSAKSEISPVSSYRFF